MRMLLPVAWVTIPSLTPMMLPVFRITIGPVPRMSSASDPDSSRPAVVMKARVMPSTSMVSEVSEAIRASSPTFSRKTPPSWSTARSVPDSVPKTEISAESADEMAVPVTSRLPLAPTKPNSPLASVCAVVKVSKNAKLAMSSPSVFQSIPVGANPPASIRMPPPRGGSKAPLAKATSPGRERLSSYRERAPGRRCGRGAAS